MKRFNSLTTDTKIGSTQYIIEKILSSKHKLSSYFWSKKKADKFSLKIYEYNKRLYRCLKAVEKQYGEDIVFNATTSLNTKQLQKICELVKYNQVGKIIAGIKFYCNREQEKQNRINAPKDTRPPEKIEFSPGEDLRDFKSKKKKRTIWELLNGKEKEED